MLRKFLLRDGGDRNVVAKYDGARGRGALIDGENKGHDENPGVDSRKLLRRRRAGSRQPDRAGKVKRRRVALFTLPWSRQLTPPRLAPRFAQREPTLPLQGRVAPRLEHRVDYNEAVVKWPRAPPAASP